MLKANDIVRSNKQSSIVISYIIKEIKGTEARCINLIDKYSYTIPLDELYIWVN